MSSQNHLTAFPLELHTDIFSNLQPYDILQVRQTCKALYLASSQRTVWTDALHRICVENTLFEPSFPVTRMSILELQRASMGPHRWIARTSSKERNSDDVLPHVVSRYVMPSMDSINNANRGPLHALYLVPGGRYLFSFSIDRMVLWDLGPPHSSGKEPYIISTEFVESHGLHLVHSTPDGLGLRIFLLRTTTHYADDMASFDIYEIYPESTSPQITRIACICAPYSDCESFYSLSYDRLIFAYGGVMTVWDYKANTWARWGVESGYRQIVITKSTVTLIRTYGISVWKIPPLLPESSLSMSTVSVMSPVFDLDYPDDHYYPNLYQAPCDWYSGTPQPLYYDVVENPYADPRKINRFEITIDSNASGGTLDLLKTFEVPPAEGYFFPGATRICQDKDVTICTHSRTGFLRTHVTDMYDQQLPSFLTPLCDQTIQVLDNLSFCPVAGRVVYCESNPWSFNIIILDF